ncbi:MAG: DUF1707 SHOCT-like domain-containing protein [Longimicrobiales bacterium]
MSETPTAPSATDGSGTAVSALARRRQQVTDVLCRAFADDGLDMDGLEQRLDAANRAQSLEQLDRLIADLPAPGGAAEARSARSSEPPPAPTLRRRLGSVVAILGGVSRTGRWTPPEHLIAVGCLGGAELDYREVELPAGGGRITAIAFMGGVDIIVPPGLRVEVDGVALLGGFGHEDSDPLPTATVGPVLRIDGVAIMGGVEVSIRVAGESAKDARRRRRHERRRRR